MATKLPLELMMEHMHQALEKAFSIDPALQVVAVTFSWKVGNSELPFGIMVGRDGDVSAPSDLLSISQQTSKMLMHQADTVSQMFEQADEIAASLAERIKALKGELDNGSAKP
jgi:hypothetical protein